MPDLALPELSYSAWKQTKQTLHLYAQIVGKIKLETTPPRNHWWNIAFHLDVRGLTTRRLTLDGMHFDLTFDFLDHRLVLRTDAGATSSFPLEDGLMVAAFDAKVHELLRAHGLDVTILEQPYGMPVATPFPDDEEHARYEREYVERFWHTLVWVDSVLDEFSSWFCGKQSPVHLFWHGLDLAYTRFSGRRAPPLDGVDAVAREAYSHEVISFGFWPGDDGRARGVPLLLHRARAAGPPRSRPLGGGSLARTTDRLVIGRGALRRDPHGRRSPISPARFSPERLRGGRRSGGMGRRRPRLLGLPPAARAATAAGRVRASRGEVSSTSFAVRL